MKLDLIKSNQLITGEPIISYSDCSIENRFRYPIKLTDIELNMRTLFRDTEFENYSIGVYYRLNESENNKKHFIRCLDISEKSYKDSIQNSHTDLTEYLSESDGYIRLKLQYPIQCSVIGFLVLDQYDEHCFMISSAETYSSLTAPLTGVFDITSFGSCETSTNLWDTTHENTKHPFFRELTKQLIDVPHTDRTENVSWIYNEIDGWWEYNILPSMGEVFDRLLDKGLVCNKSIPLIPYINEIENGTPASALDRIADKGMIAYITENDKLFISSISEYNQGNNPLISFVSKSKFMKILTWFFDTYTESEISIYLDTKVEIDYQLANDYYEFDDDITFNVDSWIREKLLTSYNLANNELDHIELEDEQENIW